MKAKNAMYMALGAGAALAYQKYKKPIMKKMEEERDKAMKKADKVLENMID